VPLMRRLAIVNQKGGVGKSATTKNLGAALAETGQRVLLVDLDPQGHLTRALGLPDAAAPATLAAVLLGEWSGELGELVTPYRERLDVIATNPDMFLLEPRMYGSTIRAREYRLSRLLDAFEPGYDVCLIDCPPSLGALTDNALMATRRPGPDDTHADGGGVLVPVQAEDSSLDALRLLFDQIRTVETELRVQLDVAGLVVNLYDGRRGRIATSTLAAYRAMEGLDVLAVIGDRADIREAWRMHVPVIEHAPSSEAAGWYRDLAKLLIGDAR
jgi:chromosome partitioning protein